MRKRATRVEMKGEVVQRYEADALLTEPGAAALVRRGVLRSLVLSCPDGCGETLTINLDRRAGPAWKFYVDRFGDVSLFPSVWRTTGCRSHFILWRSRLYWCDYGDELEIPMAEVVTKVRGALHHEFQSYVDIADTLGLVPWAVLSACHQLARAGSAVEGREGQRGCFKWVCK